jgi:hypothetical protein
MQIMELGPGTGSNFQFFPKEVEWAGMCFFCNTTTVTL